VILNRRTLLCTLGCLPPLIAAKKSQAKGPEVVLVDVTAKVEDARVMLDGHVRNVTDKPIRKLTVVYEILDSDKKVLTRQKGSIDEEMLDPGDEAAFSAQMQYHARGVFYRFEFEDGSEKELRAEKTGPFPLE
jgi:hypothetical protein